MPDVCRVKHVRKGKVTVQRKKREKGERAKVKGPR
jgi:hypothetical protein